MSDGSENLLPTNAESLLRGGRWQSPMALRLFRSDPARAKGCLHVTNARHKCFVLHRGLLTVQLLATEDAPPETESKPRREYSPACCGWKFDLLTCPILWSLF